VIKLIDWESRMKFWASQTKTSGIVLCMYLSNLNLPKEGVFDALHMFSAPDFEMLP
jgi:hypothetical protein